MRTQPRQLWVATTYVITFLFSNPANTFVSSAAMTSRRVQTTVAFCRCQANFERLYNNDNRNLQASVVRELKGPYDYSNSIIDSDGYYVIDGVRVLPNDDEQCYKTRRGRISKGMDGPTKAKDKSNTRKLTKDEEGRDYDDVLEVEEDSSVANDDDDDDDEDVMRRLRATKREGKGKGNGERRGKGTAKKSNGKASTGVENWGKASGKSAEGTGVYGKSGKSGKAGTTKTSMSREPGKGKGKGKKTCRARPFDADCLPPIRPCANTGSTVTTDVPTSAPQDQIAITAPTMVPTLSETTSVETLTPTAAGSNLETLTPTVAPTRATDPETSVPTSVPQALIIGTPTSVPVAFLEPTIPTIEPTIFLTSVVPTNTQLSSSPAPNAIASLQPSSEPSLAVCLKCKASNACFATSCLDDGSCLYTPLLSCPTGESCDPSSGICRSQNDLRPCVAVVDESSKSDSYLTRKWSEFRTAYPQRPFCLLQPVNEDFVDPDDGNGLYLPLAFLNDTRATQFNITREDGKEVIPNPPLADWFDLCDIAVYAATGVEFVGLYVDVSGSMDESTVKIMLANFTTALKGAGLAYKELYNGNEDWILPFLTELSTL